MILNNDLHVADRSLSFLRFFGSVKFVDRIGLLDSILNEIIIIGESIDECVPDVVLLTLVNKFRMLFALRVLKYFKIM